MFVPQKPDELIMVHNYNTANNTVSGYGQLLNKKVLSMDDGILDINETLYWGDEHIVAIQYNSETKIVNMVEPVSLLDLPDGKKVEVVYHADITMQGKYASKIVLH